MQGIEQFWFTLVKLPPEVVTMAATASSTSCSSRTTRATPGWWARCSKDDDGRGSFADARRRPCAPASSICGDIADDVDAVLLDLSLPDETGLDTLRRIVAADSTGRASS